MSASIYTRNRRAWKVYNQSRIDRAIQIDPDRNRIAFYVIPYLLNSNHPDLPGYIQDASLVGGIFLYNPGEEEEKAFRKFFPNFDFKAAEARRGAGKLHIQSIFLMGSIGTVAQTKKSDHDYWIVIDEQALSTDELSALKKKISAVEKWATEQKMEAHFFLIDIKKARLNDFGEADKESAGSSQAGILKEEFYRTVILAAGKDPMWWIFPPGLDDEEYERHKEDLLLEGDMDESEVVDLGAAGAIPMEELFGALLWQFNKALESPNKSVLKMALMESMISAGPSAGLLCDILKGAIHSNPEGSDQADPYLLMFDYIRRFYLKSRRKADTRNLEKCFFLKSFDSPIKSVEDDASLPYKERTLRLLLRHWKWDKETLDEMNNFPSWDFRKTAKLATYLHNFMLQVYKDITGRVATKPNIKRLITDEDLTMLGRKLFTLYSRKPGKIEYLKRVMDEMEWLEGVSFAADIKKGQKPIWSLYRDNITSQVAKGQQVENQALKKANDPVELMTWAWINRIYARNSFIYFIPNQTPLSLKDLQQALERISSLFPEVSLVDLKKEDLLGKAMVERVLVLVNFLTERWKDDIEQLHIVYSNSWGEIYCHTLNAKAGFAKLLDVLLQTRRGFSTNDHGFYDVYVPNGDHQVRLKNQMLDFLTKKYLPRRGAKPASS